MVKTSSHNSLLLSFSVSSLHKINDHIFRFSFFHFFSRSSESTRQAQFHGEGDFFKLRFFFSFLGKQKGAITRPSAATFPEKVTRGKKRERTY